MNAPRNRPLLDLVIVGGGPAGLATALHAARAGWHCVVLEPRQAPVDKACGEGLMPGAVAALAELGVEPRGVPLAGIRYLDGRHAVEAEFRAGPGLGVRRTELHAAMADAVREAGVEVRPEPAGALWQEGDRVHVGDLTARWVVAADGLHSPIRRALGLSRPPSRLWPTRYGLRAHAAIAPWTDHVEVYWAGDAEAYVTPVAPDLVGVALLSSRRVPYAEGLRAFPQVLDRLGGAVPVATSVRGAGPLRQRVSRRVLGRVLLVGDAAGYVDALTGEGISVAIASARVLVRSIATGSPESYEAGWRVVSRRYRWLTNALVAATGPVHAGRLVVPAAVRLPRVFEAAVDQLARPA